MLVIKTQVVDCSTGEDLKSFKQRIQLEDDGTDEVLLGVVSFDNTNYATLDRDKSLEIIKWLKLKYNITNQELTI